MTVEEQLKYHTDPVIHQAVHVAYGHARIYGLTLDANKQRGEARKHEDRLLERLVELFVDFDRCRSEQVASLTAEVIRLKSLVVEPMPIGGTEVKR